MTYTGCHRFRGDRYEATVGSSFGPWSWLDRSLSPVGGQPPLPVRARGNTGLSRLPSAPLMSRAKASRTAGCMAGFLAWASAPAGAPGQALVGVQRNAPMPGCCKQGVAESIAPVLLQERGRKPGRPVAVQDLSCFHPISAPAGSRGQAIGFGEAAEAATLTSPATPTVRQPPP